MEFFQEDTFLYNITAVFVVLVLFLLILKFVESLAKTLLIFIGVLIVGYGLIQFFPKVVEPITRFVGFGLTSEEESNTETSHTDYERKTYLDNSANRESSDFGNNDNIYDSGRIYKNDPAYGTDNTYQTDSYNDSGAYNNNTAHDNERTYNSGHRYKNNTYDSDNVYDESDTYDEVDNYY